MVGEGDSRGGRMKTRRWRGSKDQGVGAEKEGRGRARRDISIAR